MKNISVFLIMFFFILLCTSISSAGEIQKLEETTLSNKEPESSDARVMGKPETEQKVSFKVSDVSISRQSFNPAKGEAVTIFWHISRPAKAIIHIFDRDNTLVRDILAEDTGDPGFYNATWDGKDMDGNIVPDEAYYFTIEANAYSGELTLYDPTTFSGEESLSFPVEFDATKRAVTYELSQTSRVLIRAGVTQGPLLKTLMNWEPRLSGMNKEPWDGKDASGAINAADLKGFTIMSDALTLPENSILTTGNKEYTYLEYKSMISADRPTKEKRPRIEKSKTQTDLQFSRPVMKGLTPRFYLKLPQNLEKNDHGHPIVSGKLPVKIYLDEKVKRSVTELRYEIISYVDFKFITEQEEGYSPSTWILDTKKIPDGEHILTVNVATLEGQMATASCVIFVNN